MTLAKCLRAACDHADQFLVGSPETTQANAPFPHISALGHVGIDDEAAIQELIQIVAPRVTRSGSGRYFGFVIGGATPVSMAADWLTSVWDQNAQAYGSSPVAAEVEATVAGWLLDLLALPATASVGFVSGAQMANFTALCVARNEVLGWAGWDYDGQGLFGAPPVGVFLSEAAHATVRNALRMAGFGESQIRALPADDQGRMFPGALRHALESHAGPKIICAQAGNVNTGAFEDFRPIAELAIAHGAWLHVDGAFGLWARASPRFCRLAAGCEHAHSWSVDAHKWLNVPYDSGWVIVRDPRAHARFKTAGCAYAGEPDAARRDGATWAPENSRRARAFVLFAALRALGVSGVADLVDRCCDMAQRFAGRVVQERLATVLNDVCLNQVMLRLNAPAGVDAGGFHEAVAAAIQSEGLCWMGTGQWRGERILRLSFSNWQTDIEDVEAAVSAVARAVQAVASTQKRSDT